MEKQTISVEAPAKVNLTFEIKGLFDDGYHAVKTLMQSISLADILTFSIAPSTKLSIDIALEGMAYGDFPLGPDNLIARAIRLYLTEIAGKDASARENSNWQEGLSPLEIKVETKKRIPIGAGLAGGSADAAAALVALNHYHGNALDIEQLKNIGSQLGADVPFCLCGGTMVGTGRGDMLTPVANSNEMHFVLAKPRHLGIATPWAYKTFDDTAEKLGLSERLKDRGIANDATDFASQALQDGDLSTAIKAFGNDFEQAIFPHYKELKATKHRFLEAGALACHMTGSGPTIYALAGSQESAEKLKEKFDELLVNENTMVCATKFDQIDLYVASTKTGGASVLLDSGAVS